jgi:hypothetical protein
MYFIILDYNTGLTLKGGINYSTPTILIPL